MDTTYPFSDNVTLVADATAPFTLVLRVPAWCKQGLALLPNGSAVVLPPGSLAAVAIEAGSSKVALQLVSETTFTRRFNDALAVSRGALVFSLNVSEQWTATDHHWGGSYDWRIENRTEWAVGLVVPEDLSADALTFVARDELPPVPFSPEGAPVFFEAPARALPAWTVENGAAAPPPQSPVPASSAGPPRTVRLIPYGATQLRITEFPQILPEPQAQPLSSPA
jgi:hypothetical protein